MRLFSAVLALVVLLPVAAMAQDDLDPGEEIPVFDHSIDFSVGYAERRGGGASNEVALGTLTYTELFFRETTMIGFVTASTSDFAQDSVNSESDGLGAGAGVSHPLGPGLFASGILSIVQNGATLGDLTEPELREGSKTKTYSASMGLTQFVPVASNMFVLAGLNVTPSLTRVDNDDRGDSNFSAIRGDANMSLNYFFSPRIAFRASVKASYGSRSITLSGQHDLYAVGVGSQYTFAEDLKLRGQLTHELSRDHRGNAVRIGLTKEF